MPFQNQIVRKTIYFPTEMYYNGLVKWGNIISARYLFSFAKEIVMLKLLAVFAASLVLAYISEQNTKAAIASGRRYVAHKDWAYVLLVTILVLFAGLRTSYNDTTAYIRGFNEAPTLVEFLSDPENLNPFKNPLFYFYQSFLKTCGFEAQALILTASLLTQVCFVRFLKCYSTNFVFSIFIYFTLGTFVLTLAAMKQVFGMAVLTLAFPYLERRQWVRYYLVIILAMLFHTYAIAFAVLPLFSARPWRKFTFLFVFAIVVIMMNFEETITEFMEQANDLGKTLAEYEVFDDNTINIFRLAVYAVTPMISFLLQKWVFHDADGLDHVLIHMSIISLAFMSMGTQSGANMFARMSMYFELGTICSLPKMLERSFEPRSHRLIVTIAVVCFLGFFIYANGINASFDAEYRAVDFWFLP